MFLDSAFGILGAIIIASYSHKELSYLFVFLGISFALLPDIDVLYYAFKKYFLKKKITNHRSLTHTPFLYVPVAALLYDVFGWEVGVLFSSGILFHFIHDSLWLGWGIAWLSPFSKRKIRFFPDKNGKISNQFFMTWQTEEEEMLIKKYHDPHWIKNFYLKPGIVSYVEYTAFIIAIAVLSYTFF